MSFLFPAFLIGAVAVAIPIVLHLMKRDAAPQVAFSDIRFLQRAPMMQQRRRRLRELLLLAMRVAALLLLALAFARPFFDDTGVVGRPVTVVALDRSFSMGAPGTWDRAREAAVEVITSAPSDHVVALVAFDHGARIVHQPSVDRSAVAAAVGQIDPGAGTTRFRSAVAASLAVIGAREGRVVVVSDLQQSGWEGDASVDIPSRIDLDVEEVGQAGPNIAVSAVEVGPAAVTIVVENTGAERSTTVTVSVDDQVATSESVVLPAGATETVLDTPPLPSSGFLEVLIADPDGFPADNRRYAVLDPPAPAALGIVTASGLSEGSSFYLERALLAGEEEGPFSVATMAATEVSARDLGGLDAMIVMSTEGLDRQGRERITAFVSGGGGLLVAAGPTLEPALVADLLGANRPITLGSATPPPAAASDSSTVFSVTDPRHPVFRSFAALVGTLAQVRVRESRPVAETDGTRVLARFNDGGAALVEYAMPQGRAMVFASDLNNEWNDFPRQPMFVPFVHELVQYLVGERERRQEIALDELPAGMEAIPGPSRLPESGRPVVVNVDPRESDSSRLTADGFRSHVVVRDEATPAAPDAEADAVAQEANQGYWWYALVAVGVLLVGEAWLGRSMT